MFLRRFPTGLFFVLFLMHGLFGVKVLAQTWSRPLLPEFYPEDDPAASVAFEGWSAIDDAVDELAAQVRVVVHRRPRSFEHEFGLLVVGGKIRRAFVVSTARDGKAPILGKYRLEVPRVNGKPWPWRVSIKYDRSPMFWALQIDGGYFLHSSPHYGNLGAPASNGCIRTSYPDAMEVFDAVVNLNTGRPSIIELHEGLEVGSGTPDDIALDHLLRQSQWTVSDLERALQISFEEVRSVSKGDVEYAPGVPADAHVRPFAEITEKMATFPTCGVHDCWSLYRRPRRILRLKPHVIFRDPSTHVYYWSGSLPMGAGSRIFLQDLIPGGLAESDPFLIREIRLGVKGASPSPRIRICETESKVCSRYRSPASFSSEGLVYPIYQISEQLKSSSGLFIEVESGKGKLEAVEAVYFNS
jgi:hypothetical protein